jgi:hypothetical protein
VIGLFVGTGALLAACSSHPSSSATGDTSGGGSFSAYLSCLQRNGVTLATGNAQGFPGGGEGFTPGARLSGNPSFSPGSFGPGGGGGGFFSTTAPQGVDQATWTKATQACASVRPTAGPSGGARNDSALAAYRNCMTQHGVNLTSGPANTADPTYVAAEKVCAALRPSRGPSS